MGEMDTKTTEQTLTDYLEAIPLAAILLAPTQDKIISANSRARKLLACDQANIPNFSRFVGTDLPKFLVFIDEAFHKGSAWTRKISLSGQSDNLIQCEIRAQLHTSDLGSEQPLVTLLFLELGELSHHEQIYETENLHLAGLTGWKHAQTFFSELELQNQLILNAAGEGIYGVNTKGHATFVNRAAQEMLGWTSEDLLGKVVHDIIHHHHTDGRVHHSHDCPIYKSFRFEKVMRVEDDVFWRKDGKPIQVEYVSTPIYDQRILAGAVIVFRDVTDRKSNEKKLLAAMTEVAELRDRLEQENAYLQLEITKERAHHNVIGRSSVIQQLHAKIDLVAPTNAPVLITGETGTGKTIVANEIHKNSGKKDRPLIHFKCGSMSRTAIEAELFGRYDKAANGQKTNMTSGALELAHGGTLFVENICDLPFEIQQKLLQALQDGKFRRVGDHQFRNLNVRIIAASTKNVEKEVSAGRFSEDLFLTLNVFPIDCVPLRDRREDIPDLVTHLLSLACERLNRRIPIVTERTMRMLSEYAWPGNIKELRNVIERAAIVSIGGKLLIELGATGEKRAQSVKTVRTEHEMQLEIRANIVSALRETKGKVSGKTGAAALLGIEPTTLYSRIKKFEIEKNEWQHLELG
ncbi:MAG: sigma 54-interacting transcriptional regulator [Pseudomonadota bacterium]